MATIILTTRLSRQIAGQAAVLDGMDCIFRCQRMDRPLAADRLQRHLCLELTTMLMPLHRHQRFPLAAFTRFTSQVAYGIA
ncbi:MAG: hypothetical protein ACREOH_12740 [Candidatus Entotheonellia bacterium]